MDMARKWTQICQDNSPRTRHTESIALRSSYRRAAFVCSQLVVESSRSATPTLLGSLRFDLLYFLLINDHPWGKARPICFHLLALLLAGARVLDALRQTLV